MKFTIDRDKWRSGGDCKNIQSTGKGATLLFNQWGYMCCLGQCSHQLGFKKHQMLNVSTPSGLPGVNNIFCKKDKDDYNHTTELAIKAMSINDNQDLNRPQREKQLKRLFKSHGHEIEFINQYPKKDGA